VRGAGDGEPRRINRGKAAAALTGGKTDGKGVGQVVMAGLYIGAHQKGKMAGQEGCGARAARSTAAGGHWRARERLRRGCFGRHAVGRGSCPLAPCLKGVGGDAARR
jgi:hypothetical protein